MTQCCSFPIGYCFSFSCCCTVAMATAWILLVTIMAIVHYFPLLDSSTTVADSTAVTATGNVTDNPADQLVDVLNSNRTNHKQAALYDNPGLACLALQYIKAYEGNCDQVGGSNAKRPKDSAFAETFAPNCNVLPSTLSQITGRLLGCQAKYVVPSIAFSRILMKNNKSLEILYDKNHTEVGAAVSGSNLSSPYFWCILFSNGQTNSSFALEGGVVKVTRPGCFSGANDVCSGANQLDRRAHILWLVGVTVALIFSIGVM